MKVGMKRKPDPKEPGKREVKEPSPAERLRQLMEQLEQRPELLKQVEVLVGLASNNTVEGPVRRAEDAELRIIEATRQLGSQTMAHWAQEAQDQAVASYRAEHPKSRVKKKPH